MKKILVFSFVLVLLIGNILAQIPLGVIAELSNDVIISGTEKIKTEELKNGNLKITLLGENSKLCIKEICFENILSQDKARLPSYILLNEKGEIIEAKFTVGGGGGTYTLGGVTSKVGGNKRVRYTKDEGLELPENSEVIKIEGKGKISVEENEYIKLPTGHMLSGTLNYENEQVFIVLGESIEINHVEIEHFNEERLNIYFDGKEHEGVSFGDGNLIVKSISERIIINPKKNNPYMQIDEGDKFTLKINKNSEIKIINRDSQGDIPKVTIKGYVDLVEDSKEIQISGNKINIDKSPGKTTTSPIELIIEGKNEKIFIDNANRFSFFDKDEKFSPRIDYNYVTKQDIEKLTGKKLEFYDVQKGFEDMNLVNLRDWWETLTPETQNSFENIYFASNDYFEKNFWKGDYPETVNAFATNNKEMVFRASERFKLDTFLHEAAHEYHFQIQREWENEIYKNIEIKKLENQIKDFLVQYDKEVNPERKMGLVKPLIELINKRNSRKVEFGNSPFDKKWKDKYITDYGETNHMENVAEWIMKIKVEPELFKQYINPSSSKYNSYYKDNLDLLKTERAISEKEYNKILEVAGVK